MTIRRLRSVVLFSVVLIGIEYMIYNKAVAFNALE